MLHVFLEQRLDEVRLLVFTDTLAPVLVLEIVNRLRQHLIAHVRRGGVPAVRAVVPQVKLRGAEVLMGNHITNTTRNGPKLEKSQELSAQVVGAAVEAQLVLVLGAEGVHFQLIACVPKRWDIVGDNSGLVIRRFGVVGDIRRYK